MSCINLKTELGLISALSNVPALVEEYIVLVDQVMWSYGFDSKKSQFASPSQARGSLPSSRLDQIGALPEKEQQLALAG